MPHKTAEKFLPLFFTFFLCVLLTFSSIVLELRHSPYISSMLYFYVVPIAVAAYGFGLNAALFVSFLCCLLYAPLAARHIAVSFTLGLQEALSFILFVFIGLVSGFFSERLKKEKEHAYFHSQLHEKAGAASYDVEQFASSFLKILMMVENFQVACFYLETSGKTLQLYDGKYGKSSYAQLSAQICEFIELAAASRREDFLIQPHVRIKFCLHFPFESGKASGFVQCLSGLDEEIPSPSTQKLLHSLCAAFITHIKKSLFHQDIVSTARFLEHLLAAAPFGVLRCDENGNLIYKNSFLQNNESLAEKVLDAVSPAKHVSASQDFSILHEGKDFLFRRLPEKPGEHRVSTILVQDLQEKKNYEKAGENYRIRSLFLKQVSVVFLEKIEQLEKAFQGVKGSVSGESVDAARHSCAGMLSYVDKLLEQAKTNFVS